jgi:hypothetical protein
MNSMSITNYDVLVEPPMAGKSGEYQLAKHKNHVGNNRLEVFLNLYQQAYNGARQRGDFNECNNLVDKIVGTVCHQCVPRGRFLVSSTADNGNLLWNQMDEDMAKALLHQVLQPTKYINATNSNHGGASPNDEGQKRRRRSSLLRRSASESMVMGLVVDSKKKLTRMERCREEPTWRSTSSHRLLTPSRMDVILTRDREALDPNSQSVGNNRLHILVAMQSSKYQQASIDGKEAVLHEVIQTVNMFWKGRFLVEGSNGHEELDKEEARNALRSIFDMRSGQSLAKRHSLPTFEIPHRPPPPTGLSKQVSMPVIHSRLPTFEIPHRPPLPTALSKQVSMPVIHSRLPTFEIPHRPPPPTALSKQVTMPVIPSRPAIQLPDVGDLRSAAVRSLQKQKQRQTIASRLEQTSRRNVPTHSANPIARHPFQRAIPRGPQKRESTVLGKLDASVMEQLVADFDDADCNDDDDNSEPLPPTNSNKFGSQFTGGRDSFADRSHPMHPFPP